MSTEKEAIKSLKQAMNYVDDTKCCASCKNFRNATDGNYFGGPQQEPEKDRCALNVIEVPVSVGGRCDHFKKREPLVRLPGVESL